ncbi:MAG: Sapep family Mn(2+)-dependent dipeptidase [Eubacteriales bacterium]|nr:Sapep family Mn(2+)-dependent dipeptidase [Eubacteriales bacterium]
MGYYKEAILTNLCELVSIPSVSADTEKVGKALEYTLNLGKELGFNVRSCAGDTVGVIEWGSGSETLGILCHVDVVPAEPLSEWKTDPFKPQLIDNKLFGRGTIDDKAMVIACLYAMKAVSDSGVMPQKKVQLILGTQEETDWTDIRRYVEEYELPDYGFTPDGEFPIQNIEKGIVDVRFTSDLNQIQALDSDGRPHIVSLDAGVMINSIPSEAKARLSDGQVLLAKGKACHSSVPEDGENAIFLLIDMIKKLDIADNVFLRLLYMLDYRFRDFYGSNLSVYKDTEKYQGFWVHRSTFVPTLIRTTENQLQAEIDARFAYGTESNDIVNCLAAVGREINFETEVLDNLPAVFVPSDRPFLNVFAKAYEKVTGLKNEFTLAWGGSYAKAMPNIVSWGPLFPGEEDTCHEPNEYIELNNLYKCFDIFKETIHQIVSTQESLK